MLVEGQTFGVKGARCIQFRTTVIGKGVLSCQRNAIIPGQYVGQVLLAILDSLSNLFRRAEAPSQHIVSKAGLLELGTQVYIVPYQGRFKGY